MRLIKYHLFVAILCYLSCSVATAQSVETCIDPSAPDITGDGMTISACYEAHYLNVALDVVSYPDMASDLVFTAPLGTHITTVTVGPGVGFNNDLDDDVNDNSVTFTNSSGNSYTGLVTFTVAIDDYGCQSGSGSSGDGWFITELPSGSTTVCSTNSDINTAASTTTVEFDIDKPYVSFVIDNAILDELSTTGATVSTHNDEHFLKFDIVYRYYKIEAALGRSDHFTLTIDPELDVSIDAVEVIDPLTLLPIGTPLAVDLDPGEASVDIEFLPADIAAYNAGGSHGYLEYNSSEQPGHQSDYILIREQLDIITGSAPNAVELPSLHTLVMQCDEAVGADPCGNPVQVFLNVDAQTNGYSTPWSIDNAMANAISLCGDEMEFTWNLGHRNAALPPPLPGMPAIGNTRPPGAELFYIVDLSIPFNYELFDFTGVRIGTFDLTEGVHYVRTGDRLNIDFEQIMTNPNIPGLTNHVGNMGSVNGPYTFSVLTWNGVDYDDNIIPITLTGFHFTCDGGDGVLQDPATGGDPRVLSLTHYSNVHDLKIHWRTMQFVATTTTLTNNFSTDYFTTVNTFNNGGTAYTYGTSSDPDTGPVGEGWPNPVTLQATYNLGQSEGPWTMGEWNHQNNTTGIDQLFNCGDVSYYAVVTVPPGYHIDGDATVYEPFDFLNPLDASVAVAQIGTTNEYVIDFTDIDNVEDLANPAAVSIEFDVVFECGACDLECVNCNGECPDFGSDVFDIEFRARCSNCATCYRAYGGTEIELFHHGCGLCDEDIAVYTSGFSFNRATLGWLNEDEYVANNQLSACANCDLERVYECDEIDLYATGHVGGINYVPGDLINFDIEYDPPVASASEENIFAFDHGTFTFDDGNGAITVNVIATDAIFYPVASAKDILRIQVPPGSAIYSLLAGVFQVVFDGTFRVVDQNTPQLNPYFYPINQVRGQFTATDPAAIDPTDRLQSCDSRGDQIMLLKIEPEFTSAELIAPTNSTYGSVDQCFARYRVATQVVGGFPVGDDFVNEYRPILDWPNSMTFGFPTDAYTFESVALNEAGSAVPTTAVTVTPGTGTLTLGNFHSAATTAGNRFRTTDRNGASIQAMRLTLRRNCVNEPAPATLQVNDLVINRVTGADCFPDMTPEANESIATDLSTLDVIPTANSATPAQSALAFSNPFTYFLSMNHSGNGSQIDNVWFYFTGPNGLVINNVTAIFPALTVVTSAGGLYKIPNGITNQNGADFQFSVNYSYPCTVVDDVFEPVDVIIHYGNICNTTEFNALTLTNGELNTAPCDEHEYTFRIYPQPTIADIIEPEDIAISSCGAVTLKLNARSLGADLRDGKVHVQAPAGFTLDASSSFVETLLLTSLNTGVYSNDVPLADISCTPMAGTWDTWVIHDILTQLNSTVEFFADVNTNLTPAALNPLEFTLVYLPTCSTPSSPIGSPYVFNYAVQGFGLCTTCNLLISDFGNADFDYFNPAPAANPTASFTNSPDALDCNGTETFHYTVDNIPTNFDGTLTVTIIKPDGIASITSSPAPTVAGDTYTWLVDIDAGSSGTFTLDFNATADGSQPCDDYELLASFAFDGFLCPDGVNCVYNESGTTDDYLVHVCCEPCSLDITLTSSPETCGLQNGSVDATVSGGVAPYSYIWNGGEASQNLTDLGAGVYCVTVLDASGCSASGCATVGSEALQVIATPINPDCSGEMDNGSIELNVSGGTEPYEMQWSNGAFGPLVYDLSAGLYCYTVTDAEGCSAVACLELTEFENVVATYICSCTDNALCYGSCTGGLNVTVLTGTAPYTFLWNDGATDEDRTGLCPGSYYVLITDANGCMYNLGTEPIEEPEPIDITPTVNDVSGDCSVCDGTIYLAIDGGLPPFEILWDNTTQEGSELTGLCAGTYCYSFMDASGCTATGCVTVSNSNPLVASESHVDATCSEATDGTIDLSRSGGTAPYAFVWDNGQTTQDLSGLPSGVYTVTVSDATGCSVALVVTIGAPDPLEVHPQAHDASCSGTCDGLITVVVNGGTAPYTFLWNDGATAQDRDELCAGNYSVSVIDASGCSSFKDVTVNEPISLEVPFSVTQPGSCSQCNGKITLDMSAVLPPFAITWSNGASGAINASLCAGLYGVTVIDANGCEWHKQISVYPTDGLHVHVGRTNVTCFGLNNGTATASGLDGVAPYTYLWSNGATIANITGLAAGTYSATVTDANGCSGSGSVFVTQPQALVLTCSMSNTCFGSCTGSAVANVSGGSAPYGYHWNNGKTTQSITQLCPGNYGVTVVDANGCTAIATAIVGQFPPLSIGGTVTNSVCPVPCTGSIALTVNGGGNSPYTYLWSNGATVANPIGLCPGTYSVSVTSANGCFAKRPFTVGLGPGHCREDEGGSGVLTGNQVHVYPNPASNVLFVSHDDLRSSSVAIDVYDMLGRKVYHVANADEFTAIDISNWSDGVYTLSIHTNMRWSSFKFVKVAER